MHRSTCPGVDRSIKNIYRGVLVPTGGITAYLRWNHRQKSGTASGNGCLLSPVLSRMRPGLFCRRHRSRELADYIEGAFGFATVELFSFNWANRRASFGDISCGGL